MQRDFVIRLTFAVHRVAGTLPLEFHQGVKETANTILHNFVLLSDVRFQQKKEAKEQIQTELEKIHWYFGQAKAGNWINPENFAVLEKGYQDVQGFLKSFQEPITPPEENNGSKSKLSERQRKIVELLRVKEKAQVWELQKVFPDVTKRTLRRDLDSLLQQDLIERQGEWNTVFYKLKGMSGVS